MKIHGPNHMNMNPYKKQIQKQAELEQSGKQQDKIEISSEAKQMQEANQAVEARQKKVAEIKQQIESGEYQIDPKATAQKMIDFWTNK
ncbi:flagellar biosynthesis anti-sigma factor FlgM [Bacillaceae bacterium S4-13-58]